MCKQTFSARRGTMFEGLRTAPELVVIVVTLQAFGCPVQAIVADYPKVWLLRILADSEHDFSDRESTDER